MGRKIKTMTLFISTATNGVDKKGRLSIPSLFRAEIAKQSRPVVVTYAAPNKNKEGRSLHAWGYDDFLLLAAKIQRLPALSPVRQRLARTLLAAARLAGKESCARSTWTSVRAVRARMVGLAARVAAPLARSSQQMRSAAAASRVSTGQDAR